MISTTQTLGIAITILSFHLSTWASETLSLMHPTIYYKPIFSDQDNTCDSGSLKPLISPENKVLAHLCAKNFARCLMEGVCSILDEQGQLRSFNYHQRRSDGIPQFKEIDRQKCPYGYGVKNICLDPYYSIAADLKVYSVGDVIFIPKIAGQLMPDGETHDGFFVIRDAGSAIQGAQRFDFYTGYTPPFSTENPFFRLGFSDVKNTIEFRLATIEESARTRNKTQYPGVQKNVFIPPRKQTSALVYPQAPNIKAERQ